jgi:acyl-CoA synthetase (AMP-forming)/AMP-acid ligase II
VLNIAGLKIAPEKIEEIARESVALEDVGATSLQNDNGFDELCVAMVIKDRAKSREYGTRIRKVLPRDLDDVRFIVVDSIPRTPETGKIRRAELKKLFQGK